MTRTRVLLISAAIIAGGAALLWVIVAYTPVRQLLPGALKGDLRADYLELAIRLDSLEQAAAHNAAYMTNISNIMQGEISPDTISTVSAAIDDSLLAASETEKAFVRSYEAQERFNLSVLTPIAAEGMIFASPVGPTATTSTMPSKGLRIEGPKGAAMSAIYRGTVVAVTTSHNGSSTVTVQHPNDFVSVYSGLDDVFVDRGHKVAAGQRIGHIGNAVASFELWHNGTALEPSEYIAL